MNYQRNFIVQFRNITDLYSSILRASNHRITWDSKMFEGKLNLETELMNVITWLWFVSYLLTISLLASFLFGDYTWAVNHEVISLHLYVSQLPLLLTCPSSCHSWTALWCWIWLREPSGVGEGTWVWAHPAEVGLYSFPLIFFCYPDTWS